MQQIQPEMLAKAVVQGQERYQRNTPLCGQLLQLLARGHPVAPERLFTALHRPPEEVLIFQ